jgi:hypothetical protein
MVRGRYTRTDARPPARAAAGTPTHPPHTHVDTHDQWIPCVCTGEPDTAPLPDILMRPRSRSTEITLYRYPQRGRGGQISRITPTCRRRSAPNPRPTHATPAHRPRAWTRRAGTYSAAGRQAEPRAHTHGMHDAAAAWYAGVTHSTRAVRHSRKNVET